MKRIFALLLALVLVFGLFGCSGSADQEAPAARDGSTASVETEASPSLSMDDIVVIVEDILNENYDDVEVSYDESTVILDVTFSGLASAVQDIITVNSSELLNAWDEVIASQEKLCRAVMNILEESGYKDVDVLLNIHNDLNPENCLLIILNESVIYDIVNSK